MRSADRIGTIRQRLETRLRCHDRRLNVLARSAQGCPAFGRDGTRDPQAAFIHKQLSTHRGFDRDRIKKTSRVSDLRFGGQNEPCKRILAPNIIRVDARDRHMSKRPAKSLVRTAGLEPARGCPRKILSLLRLPFRHVRSRGLLFGRDCPRPAIASNEAP